MDLREGLGSYEILAIALVMVGVILLLVSGLIYYVAFTNHVGAERLAELSKLRMKILQLASFLLGIGLFMVFRRIYQKLDLGYTFKIVNYTYLILVLFSLYPLYFTFFPDGPGEPIFIEDFTLHFLSIFVLPSVRRILLAIMFIFVFIVTVKREWGQESDSTPKPQTEEPLESDL